MYDIFLPSVTVNEPSLKETEQPPSVSTATEGICFSSVPRYIPNVRYVSPVPQSHVVTAKRRPYIALPALETFTVIAFEFEKCPKFANVFLLFKIKQYVLIHLLQVSHNKHKGSNNLLRYQHH